MDINQVLSNLESVNLKADVTLTKQLKLQFRQLLEECIELDVTSCDYSHYIFAMRELTLHFPEILNSFVLEWHDKLKGELSTQNISQPIIKFYYFVSVITFKLGQSNQILTNLVESLNSYLSLICALLCLNDHSLNHSLLLLRIAFTIQTNIACYNPCLIICLNKLLKHLFLKVRIDSLDELSLDSISILNAHLSKAGPTFILRYAYKLLESIFDFYKSNTNFDVIFLETAKLIKSYSSTYFKPLISFYDVHYHGCLSKKSVPIMFMVIKPKELATLEPDWETLEERDEATINKSMERKLKRSRRQLTRNLKKEAIVIGQERRNRDKKVEIKRKEDIKFTNQFIEQTTLEHKKLMTSTVKKRHKLKKNKK